MSLAFSTLGQLLPLMVLILAGFFLGHRLGIDHRGPTAIVLYAAVPCLLIHQINREVSLPWFLMPAILITLATVILGSYVVLRMLAPAIHNVGETWAAGRVRPMAPAVMFMSYAYVALPFAQAVGGDSGLRIALLIYICGALFAYTLGVFLLSGSMSIRPIFRLPLLYAFLLGFAIRFVRLRYQVELPEVALASVESIGRMASPLILLTIGMQLSGSELRHLRLGFGGGLLRICLGGLLGVAVTGLMVSLSYPPLTPLARRLLCMVALLPSAAINAVLAQHFRYRADVVEAVVVSSYVLFGFFGTLLVALLFR